MTSGNTPHSAGPHAAAADAFDELASLYLTDDAQSAPQREPAFRELLIVGNLPVRAGVWLTPYADALARENGPTALVRLDLQPPTLELLRASQGAVVSEREGEEPDADAMSLRDAVLRASREVGVWVIRGSLQSAEELAKLHVDRITILTSKDSAAIVAAYQHIKEIVEAVRGARSQGADDLPPIALAIVGAEREEAADLTQRVSETAVAQLGVRVSLAHYLPKMDSGVRCTTFASFHDVQTPSVGRIMEWIDAAEARMQAEAAGHGAGASEGRPQLRLTPFEQADGDAEREALLHDPEEAPHPAADGAAAPQIETITHAYQPPRPRSASARPTQGKELEDHIKLSPKPAGSAAQASMAETPHAQRSEEFPSLASFVSGLTLLPVHCPLHEQVELAVDGDGRLHVLGRESELRDIRTVEGWARTHAQLLAMACAAHRVNAEGEIICHLFTDEPASVADMHGSGLRLHVLAPVRIGEQTAWYAAPLTR